MKPFKHMNASSVGEALSLLGALRGRARLMAGGTDLLGVLKDEILPEYPEALINTKTIPGLDQIIEDPQGLRIGAMTKLVDLVRSPIVREKIPILSDAAESVATPEIRNMASIGGNLCQDTRCWYYRYPHHMGGRISCYRKGNGPCHALKGDNRYHAVMGGKKCHAVCPSDTAIPLTALGALVKIAGPDGEREIPVEDLFGLSGTILTSAEMLTEIRIPHPPENVKQTFLKFTLRKPVDFAIASVASVLSLEGGVCKDARIVLGALAPTPIRAHGAEEIIRGRTVTEDMAEETATAAVRGAKPMSMNDYKVEITRALVKRAILQ